MNTKSTWKKKAPAKEKIGEMDQTMPMKGDMKAKMGKMKEMKEMKEKMAEKVKTMEGMTLKGETIGLSVTGDSVVSLDVVYALDQNMR